MALEGSAFEAFENLRQLFSFSVSVKSNFVETPLLLLLVKLNSDLERGLCDPSARSVIMKICWWTQSAE